MKHRKISAVAAGLAVATMALAGCASGGGGEAASEESTDAPSEEVVEENDADGDISVALISKGFQHQFWQAVKAGADQAAEEFGVKVTFEGPDSEANVEQQVQQLQTALDRNPSALGIAALDSVSVEPLLQQADAAGIPIIAFDSGVESDLPVTTVATDNKAAAAEAAKQLAEAINHEGKVAMIVHDQTSGSGIDRRDGFVEYMEANEPNIEIVDIQYGGGDQAKSADIVKAIISANPDLAGFYGSNEGSAIGMVQGYKESGLAPGEIVLVGFDSGKAQVDAIRDGLMFGAVTQNPVGIGYETVKSAIAAIKGETLPEFVDPGFYFYTKDNVDDAEIAAVLYD